LQKRIKRKRTMTNEKIETCFCQICGKERPCEELEWDLTHCPEHFTWYEYPSLEHKLKEDEYYFVTVRTNTHWGHFLKGMTVIRASHVFIARFHDDGKFYTIGYDAEEIKDVIGFREINFPDPLFGERRIEREIPPDPYGRIQGEIWGFIHHATDETFFDPLTKGNKKDNEKGTHPLRGTSTKI